MDCGDLCVYCGNDTAFGGGRFVNRIGADLGADIVHDWLGAPIEVTLNGWMCPDCQTDHEEDA